MWYKNKFLNWWLAPIDVGISATLDKLAGLHAVGSNIIIETLSG